MNTYTLVNVAILVAFAFVLGMLADHYGLEAVLKAISI